MIFVFGSNQAGIHGAGAARVALEVHGAMWGIGSGHVGNSYAIPTKDHRIQTLPLSVIQQYVASFLKYAYEHPNLEFQVTRIGCGLAGYKDADIAPFFAAATPNCWFDKAWTPFLGEDRNYWETM